MVFFAYALQTRAKSGNFATAMKITDYIKNIFRRNSNHAIRWYGDTYGLPWEISRHKFGEAVYLNIAQILTDLYAELTWTSVADSAKWSAWKDWANRNGQRILLRLMRSEGYVVIGYHSTLGADGKVSWYFYELPRKAYRTETRDDVEIVKCFDEDQMYYVLRSPTFEQTGMSDHEICKPFIAMIDAVLNGATTTSEQLGAYVVMTPKADNFGGVLTQADKEELEKTTQEQYGMLRKQRQMMIMPRPMDSQIVSLASVDTRMKEKVDKAILGIADRLKVPANQIAMIDGGQTKAFANGTEYREGDMAKYRTFRRLVDATLYDMAKELGMRPDYTLENEPKSVQGQTIENAK